MRVDDFHQCVCLSHELQIQNPPTFLSKFYDILSALTPKKISIWHTPKKIMMHCFWAKEIFTAEVFGDPIPFSCQVLKAC